MLVVLWAGSAAAQWQMQESHTQESLRGLSVWNDQVVWASGTHGTYVVTRDGGKSWKAAQVPGAEALDFRDVEAFGDTVYLLAAGPGEQSRIYKTTDGGGHWQLQFTNHEPKGFFDCMAFWDERHGIAVGDPVNGKFQIITTANGGKTWELSDGKKMPPAVAGEGAFAASGTCIAVQGKKNAWFVTGGAARAFRSTDQGGSWKVSNTPMVHGPASAGIFSIAFADAEHGVIAGGDYQHPDAGDGVHLAMTDDGGSHWEPVVTGRRRYISCVSYLWTNHHAIVVAGASGSSLTVNLRNWRELGTGFNAVAVDASSHVPWAVGSQGRVAKLAPPRTID